MMATNNNSGNYEAFLQKRNTLLSLIERQIALLSPLGITTWQQTLHQLKERVSNDAFKVLIVGEFKRGKSTFINALLGEEILPAYSTPCTAIINEVKWGEPARAVLHYIKTEDGVNREAEEIPVQSIEEYVVIPEEPDENYVNIYEKVEIFYPLELCRSGVEVIDSPGLNEHTTRSQVTENYLPIVDAIIFVFTCEALASQSEIRFIENNLQNLGHEDLFFICNKFDQIRDKEKDRVKKFAINKLAPLTSRGEDGVFFVSAFDALEGRLNNDQQRESNSGLPILEKKLEQFLTSDRGRLKIIEPAKDLQESIKEAKRSIPQREAMLKTNRAELEKRYLAAQEPLQDLEVRRKQLRKRITQFLDDARIRLYDDSVYFLGQLNLKVEQWLDEYELKSRINLNAIPNAKMDEAIKSQIQPIIEELKDYLIVKVEEELINWQKEKIEPYISTRLESLKEDISARTSDFLRLVDEIRSQLASGSTSTYAQDSVISIERLFAASGVSSNHSSFAWLGSVLSQGKNKAVVYTFFAATVGVGVSAFVAALGVFNPLLFALALPFAMSVAKKSKEELKRASKDIEDKTKKEIVKMYCEDLDKSREDQAVKIATSIVNKLNIIQDTVDQGLAKEIQNIRDQCELVLKEKNKGQTEIDQAVSELSNISKNLTALEGELDDLINQLTIL